MINNTISINKYWSSFHRGFKSECKNQPTVEHSPAVRQGNIRL